MNQDDRRRPRRMRRRDDFGCTSMTSHMQPIRPMGLLSLLLHSQMQQEQESTTTTTTATHSPLRHESTTPPRSMSSTSGRSDASWGAGADRAGWRLNRRGAEAKKTRRISRTMTMTLLLLILAPNLSSATSLRGGHQRDVTRRSLQTQTQCEIAMSIGDSNRDDKLTRDPEYVRYLTQLTRNSIPFTTYDALPDVLKENFERLANGADFIDIFGSKPGVAGNDEFLIKMCEDTKVAIASIQSGDAAAPPTGTPGGGTDPPTGTPGGASDPPQDCSQTILLPQCFTAIAIADLTRDDWLDQSEFVRFVNRVSKGQAGTDPNFALLRPNVQAVFTKFADTFNGNRIDVAGSKPGQRITSDQNTTLSSLCCETDLAWQNTGPTPQPPVAPPTPVPEFSPSVCRTAMASSDFNRDDYLNQSEFVRYLNRLTNNQFMGFTFDQLQQGLQDLYNRLATSTDGINVFGSKPGQTEAGRQGPSITDICSQTASALNGGPTDPPVETPVAPPVAPPVSAPTEIPTECRKDMASSDFNRDDQLSRDEYVRFLNRLTDNAFMGFTFDELEDPLKEAFTKLSNGSGQVNIQGSKPGQTPTEFLDTICITVADAIDAVLNTPTAAPVVTGPPIEMNQPTSAPQVPSLAPISAPAGPTLPPNIVEVASSFIVMNTIEIQASGLQTGVNREGMERAYAYFAEAAAANLRAEAADIPNIAMDDNATTASNTTTASKTTTESNATQTRRSLRGQRRNLAVTFVENSANLYFLQDSDCPDSVTEVNAICQTIFGNFRVRDDSVTDENFQEFTHAYINITQGFISSGRLQEALDARDPRSALTVVDASFPVVAEIPPSAAPPNDSPGGGPTSAGEISGDKEKGFTVVEIVAAVVSCFLVVAIALYFVCRGRKPPPKKKDKRKKKKKNARNSKTGGKIGENDDDAPKTDIGDETNSGGFGDTTSELNAFGADHNENDDDDDEIDGKKKTAKDKKEENKNDADTGDNDNPFGESDHSSKQSASHAKHGFDDSHIAKEVSSKKQEMESLLNDDNAFGGQLSPKGRSLDEVEGDPNKNFFGSDKGGAGWGAKASEDTEDNFFGDNNFIGSSDDYDDDDIDAMSTQSDLVSKKSGSDSDSYTSSDDGTYESKSRAGDEASTGSASFANSRPDRSVGASVISESMQGSMPTGLRQKSDDMDEMIRAGNWDGVAAVANTFANENASLADNSRYGQDVASVRSKMSRKSLGSVDEEGSYSESSRSGSECDDYDDDGSYSDGETTTTSMRTENVEKRAEYRAQVEALVKMVVPDEIGKVDSMMEQFRGREAELVATLQTMQERSATQRARAAIHKSKTRPTRAEPGFRADGAFSAQPGTNGAAEGNAAGTAIAAASLPVPADDGHSEGDDDDMGASKTGDSYDDRSHSDDQSFSKDSYGEEGSYHSPSRDDRSFNEGSYNDQPSFNEGSYNERSPNVRSYGERSYNDQDGSYTGQDRSYNDQYNDHDRSYNDQDESYTGQDRSYNDQDHSHNGKDNGDGGSFNNDDDDRSYRDDDDRSFDDGSRSQDSYDKNESPRGRDDRSFGDEASEGSYSRRVDGGRRNYYDDDDRSAGSRSYDDEGSRSDSYSDEGSDYSGDDRSYDSQDDKSESKSDKILEEDKTGTIIGG